MKRPSFLKIRSNQRGQGLIEYLIIVALMGVASIVVIRVLGKNVSAQFTNISRALNPRQQAAQLEEITENQLKKKDLGNFFHGTGRADRSENNEQ